MSSTKSKVRLEDHDPELGLTPGTAKSDIVALLYRDDEHGYRPKAVDEELDIPHNTIKTELRRLKTDGYIDQTEDGYYHAIESRKDIYRYVAALDGLDRMFADHDADDQNPATGPTTGLDQTLSEDDIDEIIDEELSDSTE